MIQVRHAAVLVFVLYVAAMFNASASVNNAHNSKLGNPRPVSEKQASPKDNEKFYFICSSESSKHDDMATVDHIVLSIAEQRLYAYHDGLIVGWSNVSTGKAGHDTPLGTFRVSQKHIDHFSNKYNNAPMPYFMRLTDDGVGMHAGILPGYAASHGCIRLPFEMSKMLYEHTPSGTPVTVIAGRVDPAFASSKQAPSFFSST